MSHPIVLVVVADGLLSLMDAIIKLLTARYPTFQIVWLRFAFGLIGAAALLLGRVVMAGEARKSWQRL